MNFHFNETINITNNTNMFENIYAFNWSMKLGIITSFINFLFFTPMFFAIAWYERYGTNQNRTLLNQLVSSICWVSIVQSCTILPLDIIVNLFGPLKLEYCTVYQVYRNSLSLNLLILITFITMVKYVYIFILNNPAGIHSEIWCLFINMFSTGFSFLAQAVFMFLPGRQPKVIYWCAGFNPSSIKTQFEKSNYAFIIMLWFCLISYCFTFTKKIFLNNSQAKSEELQTQVKFGWTLPPIQHGFDTLTFSNFGTILSCFLSTFPTMYAFVQINATPFDKLTTYPYFLLVHFIMYGAPFLQNFCLTLVFLSSSKTLRRVLFRELLDTIGNTFLFKIFNRLRINDVITIKK